MNLSHFSPRNIDFNFSRKYDLAAHARGTFKPHGLWLSDESGEEGWHNWCKDANFYIDSLKYELNFFLDTSDCVHLKTFNEIIAFNDKYITNFKDYGFRNKKTIDLPEMPKTIDWPRVKKEHKGILITPYCYSARFNYMWYYGWDCASACIWDLSALKLLN